MALVRNSSLIMQNVSIIDKSAIDSFKKYFYIHFEKIVVGVLIFLTVLTHFLIINKLMFLDIYFLPTLVAGYISGRRTGISVAIFSVALVTYFVVMSPATYLEGTNLTSLVCDLSLWGCFLILTSVVVGGLYDKNKRQNIELKSTYEGVLEILSKFIDAADKYTNGHSHRVAEMATEMAIGMRFPERQTETLRVAALLHDIGKVDVSTDVILKAAKLSEDDITELQTHVEKSGAILKPFQRLFKDAVGIILAHHKYYDNSGYGEQAKNLDEYALASLGILVIADAYDAMVSDRPYRKGKTPREAVTEIKTLAGKQFDPVLVGGFLEVMKDKLERS